MNVIRRHYITFLAATSIIVAAFTGAFSYYFAQRNLVVAEAESNMLRLSRVIKAEYNIRIFENARSLAIALSQTPEIKEANNNPKACNEMVAALYASLVKFKQTYTTFGAVNKDGDIICAVFVPQETVNVADRPYVQKVFQTKDFAVGEYQVGRLSGKPSLNVGYPILDAKGDTQGVAIVAIDLAWFNETAKSFTFPPDGAFVVVDRNGVILLRYPEPDVYIGKSIAGLSFFERMKKADEGVTEAAGVDGVKRLWGFTKNSDIGDIFIAVGVTKGNFLAPFEKIFLRNIGIVGAIAAIALIFMYADAKKHDGTTPVQKKRK